MCAPVLLSEMNVCTGHRASTARAGDAMGKTRGGNHARKQAGDDYVSLHYYSLPRDVIMNSPMSTWHHTSLTFFGHFGSQITKPLFSSVRTSRLCLLHTTLLS